MSFIPWLIGTVMVVSVIVIYLRYGNVIFLKKAFIADKKWPKILLGFSLLFGIASTIASIAMLVMIIVAFVNPGPGSTIALPCTCALIFGVLMICFFGRYQRNYFKAKKIVSFPPTNLPQEK